MAGTGSTSTRPYAGTPAHPSPGDDWVAQAADTLEGLVTTVRSKTTEPVEWIARVVVYGILAAVLGVAILVLLTITTIRVLDIILPWEVWFAYAVLGGIFTVVGLFLWGMRNRGRKSGDR